MAITADSPEIPTGEGAAPAERRFPAYSGLNAARVMIRRSVSDRCLSLEYLRMEISRREQRDRTASGHVSCTARSCSYGLTVVNRLYEDAEVAGFNVLLRGFRYHRAGDLFAASVCVIRYPEGGTKRIVPHY